MKTRKANGRGSGKSSLVNVPKRSIAQPDFVRLWVQAGGRCEFPNCGKYLLKHPLTQATGNFGEVAHIIAFQVDGPRGRASGRPQRINDLANLMLLCDACHKLVDRHPEEYPVVRLRLFKQQHEEFIYHVTAMKRSETTAIVRLEAPINGSPVSIPMEEVYKAIAPRPPQEKPTCHIDLNHQAAISKGPAFIAAARETIESRIRSFLSPGVPEERVQHISVFGLAPIPLLAVLGQQLGTTIPCEVYRHHRDTDTWAWKTSDKRPVAFKYERVQEGKDPTCVALVISISGAVARSSLPEEIDHQYSIYEIAPVGVKPGTHCLKTHADLENFKRAYEEFLRDLPRQHGPVPAIALFPAVPPPVAILCGRQLMPKIDPALRVYDYDKNQGGFTFTLEVNTHVKR